MALQRFGRGVSSLPTETPTYAAGHQNVRRQTASSAPATDGWLVALGARVGAAPGGGSTTVRLCVWNNPPGVSPEDDRKLYFSEPFSVPEGVDFRHHVLPVPARLKGASLPGVGFWADPAKGYRIGQVDAASTSHDAAANNLAAPPDPFVKASSPGRHLASYYDFQRNVAPQQGVWRAPAQNAIVGTSPTFEGTMPHDPVHDGPYDHTESVKLEVWRADTGAVIFSQEVAVTPQERAQGYFSKVLPVSLPGGVALRARFYHRDSWGLLSPSSLILDFTTTQGPNAPTLTSPSGKINVLSGYNYQGTHSHPSNLAADRLQVEVWNGNSTTKLFDSGEVVVSVASGASFSLAEFHADLVTDTDYTWRARLRDQSGNWGPFSEFKTFNTNAFPNAPTNLSPAEGAKTGSRVFGCSVSDPDPQDTVTAAEIELVRVSTGSVVAGYPKAMTLSGTAPNQTASFTAPEADMIVGQEYKWRARASDGVGFGAWSAYAQFTYQEAPVATLLAPAPASRTNRIDEPSAEYEGGSYWTEANRTASDFIDRVGDGNAMPEGIWSWRGTEGASSDNRYESSFETIDGTKPYLIRAAFKKIGTPVSKAHLALACYDNANTLLGTLYPSSIAVANDKDLPLVWTEHGGIVWPIGSANSPALPTGTIKAKVRVHPSKVSAATVRFDALSFEVVPLLSASDWTAVQPWFGYADGDSQGAGPTPGYLWAGTQGLSESVVRNVLTGATASVAISYFSSASSAKAHDRLIIQKWDGTSWASVLDTGFVASNRTIIPLPANTVTNQNRYRLMVEVKDSAGVVGSSDWAEFDTRFPATELEVPILLAQADPDRAALDITWQASSLVGADFAGYEIQVEAPGHEAARVVTFISKAETVSYSYHFPVSGREYLISVRQIKNVGADQIEGPFSSARLICEYSSRGSFLKHVEDPETLRHVYKSLSMEAQREVEIAPVERFHLWGSLAPVHVFQEARWKRGQIHVPLEGDADPAYATLKKIIDRRGVVAILNAGPPQPWKVFAIFDREVGFAEGPGSRNGLVFLWEQTVYEEDFYRREGITA